MSWGATAFTPIITYNNPPFGFHEVIDVPDFKVCNENPWISGDKMKQEIQNALKEAQIKRDVHGDYADYEYGYDEDFKKMALQDARDCKLKNAGIIENFCGGCGVCGLTSLNTVFLVIFAYILYRVFTKV